MASDDTSSPQSEPDERMKMMGRASRLVTRRMKASTGAAAIAAVAGLFLAGCLPTTGQLDTTFAGDGTTTTSFGLFPNSVVVQGDGKIVAVGDIRTGEIFGGYFTDIGLVRYNPNGSLDLSFGGANTGTVRTDGSSKLVTKAGDVTLQPDGKILVGGLTTFVGNDGLSGNMAVFRYNANGTLDTGFGVGGIARSGNVGTSGDHIAVAAGGKIVVAGHRWGRGSEVEVDRLTSTGALDSTFGTGGRVLLSGSGPASLVVQGDGRLVVASDTNVVRLNVNGSVDPTFGTNGHVSFTVDTNAVILGVQPDGKLLVRTRRYKSFDSEEPPNIQLLRFSTNGAPDTSFGYGGLASLDAYSPNGWSNGEETAVDPSGRIVVGFEDQGTFKACVARLNANGIADSSFPRTCIWFAGAGSSTVGAAAVQGDGKPVLVGDSDGMLGVARFVG